MKTRFIAISVGSMLCAVLCACNDGATVAKSSLAAGAAGTHPVTPPNPGSGAGTVDTPPAPSLPGGRIDTFAQSLETFSFAFSQTTRKLSVSFARLAPEAADTSGMPTVETTQEFEGEVPRGGTSSALVPRVAGHSDYAVRVDCADDSCRSATIQIDRLSGTLAGRAVLKREAHEMSAQGNRNLPNGRLTTSRDPLTAALAELSNHDNLSAVVTASVTKVEDGRHDWFEIRYDFLPQALMRADQPGYFDDKSVSVSGDLGPHQLVKVTRTVSYRDQQTSTTASVYGKAKFRESSFAVSVAFERQDLRNPSVTVSQSMGDPLSW